MTGVDQIKNEILFSNASLEMALKHFLNIADNERVTVNATKSITSLSITGNVIAFNGNDTGIWIQEEQIDLAGIEKFNHLKDIKISQSKPVNLNFSRSNSSISNLEIREGEIINNLDGIQNLKGLIKLSISFTNLSALDNIAKNKKIQTLYLPNNQIIDCYAIENIEYDYINLYNNMIYDHRGLRKQIKLNIWSEGAELDIGNILYCNWQDLKSRQIQVLINNLNVRSNHYTGAKANSLGYAVPGFYYILDEWWDKEKGDNWYKIGNDAWICGNEGNWTSLKE